MKLICPICSKPLQKQEKTAVCENGHSFDYASSGYLNLFLTQKPVHGDSRDMIQARTAFLNRGYYGFLKQRLQEIIESFHPHALVDLGCGEGYYTSGFRAEEKYGVDLSKDALKHASKQDPSCQYLTASIFHLPFADDSMDLCTEVFAPPALQEVQRILKKGGVFIEATPGKMHLYELKEVLYSSPYPNEEKEQNTDMNKLSDLDCEQKISVPQEDLMHLFKMTPYSQSTDLKGIDRLKAVKKLDITAQFRIRIYQK